MDRGNLEKKGIYFAEKTPVTHYYNLYERRRFLGLDNPFR